MMIKKLRPYIIPGFQSLLISLQNTDNNSTVWPCFICLDKSNFLRKDIFFPYYRCDDWVNTGVHKIDYENYSIGRIYCTIKVKDISLKRLTSHNTIGRIIIKYLKMVDDKTFGSNRCELCRAFFRWATKNVLLIEGLVGKL